MSFARDVPTRTLIRHSSSIGRLCAAIIDRDKGVDRGRMGGQKRGRGRDRGWKPRPEAEDIRALKLEQGQHEQHHQQKLHKNYRERGRERQGYLARKRENKLLHCLSGEGNTYTQMCVVVPFRPPTPLTPHPALFLSSCISHVLLLGVLVLLLKQQGKLWEKQQDNWQQGA